mmetsp:Transcript_3629/g.6368  ORF Transcript_3629/g.6368 Transcript_3629/m.6368 type:complete len:210 (+) Transcript_3629:3907-4536(+)
MIQNHGSNKFADTCSCSRGLSSKLWLKHFVYKRAPMLGWIIVETEVGIQKLARLIVDVVLLVGCEVQEVVQEVHVHEVLLGIFFVRVREKSCLDLVDDFVVWFHWDHRLVLHKHQSIEGELDDIQWVFVGLDLRDIFFGDGVAGGLRIVKERQSLVQLDLCRSLLLIDCISCGHAGSLLSVHLLGLLVSLCLLAHDLFQKCCGLFFLCS